MNIWAHTMVKNEARWLWYSVGSVINYVDKILLWDTGSADETKDIVLLLKNKYPEKIQFKERKIIDIADFAKARQEMLNETKSDWIFMLDGDEIWFEDSVKKVVEIINREGKNIDSIVVPTINLVGDIFHYQENEAGRYKFGNRVGNYNLRAINRNIPGLHSQGEHGVWGWADGDSKMVQERQLQKVKFIDAPYVHASFIRRATRNKDKEVLKRLKKLKHEIGVPFPKDFYYPEVFFRPKSTIVESPWEAVSGSFKMQSYIETPFKKIKRKIWWGKPGY